VVHDAQVQFDDRFPFSGEVIWLTPAQGGRRSGPVVGDFAATGFLPPHTVHTGLASFVLRCSSAALRGPALGRWLVVPNAGDQLVTPGAVVVVTEGLRTAAFFTVTSIDADLLDPG
jgi:hypothetical protein